MRGRENSRMVAAPADCWLAGSSAVAGIVPLPVGVWETIVSKWIKSTFGPSTIMLV